MKKSKYLFIYLFKFKSPFASEDGDSISELSLRYNYDIITLKNQLQKLYYY